MLLIIQLLALLIVANGTPIIVEKILGNFSPFPSMVVGRLAEAKVELAYRFYE